MNIPHSDFCTIDCLRTSCIAYHTMLHCLRLGIFDALAGGPQSPETLAERLGVEPPVAQAMLNLLVAAGLLQNPGQNLEAYENTPVTQEHLVSSSPFFQGQAQELQYRFDTAMLNAWARQGQDDHLDSPAREHIDSQWSTGDGMEGTAQFSRLGALQDTTAFIAALPQFLDMRLMCDLGGNHGEFSMALLARNPLLAGELLDLPDVVEAVRPRIAARGLADRLTPLACDLRTDALPVNRYDLVLASHILYGFSDDMAGFLQRVHAALKPGGWFIAQHMNPAGGMPPLQACAMELVTRFSGYPSHFLSTDQLQQACAAAGFETVMFNPAGQQQCGMLASAQKSR